MQFSVDCIQSLRCLYIDHYIFMLKWCNIILYAFIFVYIFYYQAPFLYMCVLVTQKIYILLLSTFFRWCSFYGFSIKWNFYAILLFSWSWSYVAMVMEKNTFETTSVLNMTYFPCKCRMKSSIFLSCDSCYVKKFFLIYISWCVKIKFLVFILSQHFKHKYITYDTCVHININFKAIVGSFTYKNTHIR